MAQSKRVRAFIETVCVQIKSKRARGRIGSELIAHIEDQKLAYMKEGLDEDTAEIKAVIQMGDPAAVGEDLNKLHRHERDWLGLISDIVMWTLAGIVIAFGLFCGGATIYSMFRTREYIVGAIIGLGFIAGSVIIAFVIISMFKFISNMLFYYGLAKDYQRRKKRGEFYGKH